MILACLTTAALFSISAPPSAPPSAQHDPAQDAGASLHMRIEETRVAFKNDGETPLLLLFALEDREPQLALWLVPGETTASSFPRGATRSMRVEVVKRAAAGWISSGPLSLAAPAAGAEREVWFYPSGVVLEALAGEPIAPALSSGSLIPAYARPFIHTLGGESSALPASAPLHVPVPQSTGGSSGDKPPKLEDKPLPPV